MSSLLRTGTHADRDYPHEAEPRQDGSKVTAALAAAALNRHWNLDRFRAALSHPGNAGGACYRRRIDLLGQEAADKWLSEYVWNDTAKFVEQNPPQRPDSPPPERFENLRWNVDVGTLWPGKAKTSERLVLLYLIDAAERQGTFTEVAASLREVSAETGLHTATVASAAQRLTDQGWLTGISRKGGNGGGHKANTYDLSETPPLNRTAAHTPATKPRTHLHPPALADYGHDSFQTHPALRDLLRALHTSPTGATATDLAELTGWAYPTVTAALRHAQAHSPSLLTRTLDPSSGSLTVHLNDSLSEALETLAARSGSAGARTKRRCELAKAREIRRDELSRFVTARIEAHLAAREAGLATRPWSKTAARRPNTGHHPHPHKDIPVSTSGIDTVYKREAGRPPPRGPS